MQRHSVDIHNVGWAAVFESYPHKQEQETCDFKRTYTAHNIGIFEG